MFQILQAIDFMQSSGIIHRDLKPENILVEKDTFTGEVKNVKITDFGLSKIVLPNQVMFESCGTPDYVAPEILQMNGYGKEIDIWSAGCIFYFMVCGRSPFHSQNK